MLKISLMDYQNYQQMKWHYSVRRLRRFLFCAAAPQGTLAALAFKTWGCFNRIKFNHISHVLWQMCPIFVPVVTSHMCYDKFCPQFVTSLSHFCPNVTNFMYNYSFLCIKLYIYAYFDILSHFCPIVCHMGQSLSLFWHLRNPVIPRVFTFGQKFVTFFQILSPVCHVFVTPINSVVMRFMHKIYINVTNIYKSLTKFF